MSLPKIAELKKALQILEQIQTLEAELKSVLSGSEPVAQKQKRAVVSEPGAPKGKRKKRVMSPEARARIVAAQKARWAKFRKGKG